MADFVPEHGDVVWLSSSPQRGHEQAGRRPALVLSPSSYNRKVGLLLGCPITSRTRGYPFEVRLPEGRGIQGLVLSDQLRSLDWRGRDAEIAAKVDAATLESVRSRILALLEDD